MSVQARSPDAMNPEPSRAVGRPLVEFRGVTKHYPGVQAVTDVTLSVSAGEVHAVCGENGAGKSTLVKLLAGLDELDAGVIMLDGARLDHLAPREVQRRGVAMVSQELALAPDLSVRANLFLGRETRFALSRHHERAEARRLLERVGLALDPEREAASLSVAEQQLVEIAKAVAIDARVTIMDEPTATLTATELDRFFEVVRSLRSDGIAVLYITHRLEEIFRLADRVTVMRDGRVVATLPRAELDEGTLVRRMVGRDVGELYPKPAVAPGEVVLRASLITVPGRVRECSFEVRAGEIFGLAGIVGAGRTELARAVFGADPGATGTIELHGRLVAIKSPRAAIRAGIGYVTEDRKHDGLALDLSVLQNITLVEPPARAGVLRKREERAVACRLCETLGIRASAIDRPVRQLSGGNQQKVMLARWLHADPSVIFFDEPARGVDVGAKADLFRLIGALAAAGKAVILISSYLPELLAMCDRIAVLRDGRITADLLREDFGEERIVALATGTGIQA